jgi:trimethylamine:corrinoid methyltransferase-like protein
MSVSFRPPINNYEHEEPCCICMEPLGNSQKVVMHYDGTVKERHHVHKKCIRLWVKKNADCPLCREKVNRSSLFSWKERLIESINPQQIAKAVAVVAIVAAGAVAAAAAAATGIAIGAEALGCIGGETLRATILLTEAALLGAAELLI